MFQKIIVVIVAAVLAFTGLIPAQAQETAETTSAQCSMFHTVERGDTLYRISREFNVTTRQLAAWNNLRDINRIYVGQSLCVGQQVIVDDTAPQTYTVQRGDTLSRIARRYGIDMMVLARVNNITNVNRIYAGQVLNIPEVTIQTAN